MASGQESSRFCLLLIRVELETFPEFIVISTLRVRSSEYEKERKKGTLSTKKTEKFKVKATGWLSSPVGSKMIERDRNRGIERDRTFSISSK